MANKIFVGNLPANATEESLRRLFLKHGYPVREVELVSDGGSTRGIAFVDLAPYANRRHAVNDINGNNFHGRRLIVNEWPLEHHASPNVFHTS
jgi:RNA recognition motif-containing protein